MPGLTNEPYLKEIPNGFMLTMVVSRRVKELRRGSAPLMETNLRNPVEIAFEEIKQGKLNFKPYEKPTL